MQVVLGIPAAPLLLSSCTLLTEKEPESQVQSTVREPTVVLTKTQNCHGEKKKKIKSQRYLEGNQLAYSVNGET